MDVTFKVDAEGELKVSHPAGSNLAAQLSYVL